MVDPYDFHSPPAIVFGWGRIAEIGRLALPLGRRAFVVCGSRSLERAGLVDRIRQSLEESEIELHELATISREPLVEDVDAASRRLHQYGTAAGDFLLGIGGGAALDLAKAVAAMATNRQSTSVRDYLEGVGRGLQITEPPLPVLAVPTTAGTGSEATRNAVISHLDPPFKKSLRSPLMIPRLALIDPELTVTCPAQVTAHSGMDAITQLIESYVSCRARPIPRALARHGLAWALPAIQTAVQDPGNRAAREAMAHAAMLSGLALANSGLGMAHGVAASLGVHAAVPHGLACAVMLPVALRANRDACLDDLAELATLIEGHSSGTPAADADAFIDHITCLAQDLGIPTRLSELGIVKDQLPEIVAGSRGNSMSGNPSEITDAELRELLEAML